MGSVSGNLLATSVGRGQGPGRQGWLPEEQSATVADW